MKNYNSIKKIVALMAMMALTSSALAVINGVREGRAKPVTSQTVRMTTSVS